MKTKVTLIGSVFAALVLVGCGGGGGGSASASVKTGHLVDSPVANADYDCVVDGALNKKTGSNGSFTCNDMSHVRFHVGHLILGEIHALPTDANVFPQDLLGVARTVNDNRVAAMAQLLQSIDADGNPQNGIRIKDEAKDMVETETHFNAANVGVYLEAASVNPEHIPTKKKALQHLAQSVQKAAAHHHAADAGHTTHHAAANAGANTAHHAADAGHTAGHTAAKAGHAAGHTAAKAGHAAGHTAAKAGANAGKQAVNAAHDIFHH